ncbi:Hypothetical predicted protein, partial [Mytilus galloprovincialis]
MAAFFREYATPPTVPVEKKVFHAIRHSGLNGRVPENAAMNDHGASSSCASTQGAYLWRPNTIQEANDVRDELIGGSAVWTGATFRVKDGNYIFSIENGTSFLNSVPYGE